MTDRQAKLIGIEAAWRKALHDTEFPVPHGSDNFDSIYADIHAHIQIHYEENAARMLVEVLQREMLKDMRRKECLKIAVMTLVLAATIMFILYRCVQ